MNKYHALGLGLGAAILGGFIGRSCGLEQQVQNICSRYADRKYFAFTLKQGAEPVNIPELFSRYEHFTPVRVDNDYLARKLGFVFEEDLRQQDANEQLVGTLYRYNIDMNSGNEPAEHLRILNFDGTGIIERQTIAITVTQGKVKSLYINDEVNNYDVLISRRDDGPRFNPAEISEAAAKKLWDLYSTVFFEFKRKNNLVALLEKYVPKLEVKHNLP